MLSTAVVTYSLLFDVFHIVGWQLLRQLRPEILFVASKLHEGALEQLQSGRAPRFVFVQTLLDKLKKEREERRECGIRE